MNKKFAFKIDPITGIGSTFRYSFPPMCVQCGRPTEKTISVELRKTEGNISYHTTIQIPYCDEHISTTQKLKNIKRMIYLATYIITVAIMALLGFDTWNKELVMQICSAAFFGLFVWGVVVATILNLGMIRPLMGIFDKEEIFDCETNTSGFTARIKQKRLFFYFSDITSAQRFQNANLSNPLITTENKLQDLIKKPKSDNSSQHTEEAGYGIEVVICPNCETVNSLSVVNCRACQKDLSKENPVRNPYL